MVHSLSPAQALELIDQGNVEVIDVRETHEWLTGHVAGARHVPLASFRANPSVVEKSGAVIFVCAAGVRSETAARLAVANGAERVYNLVGGTRAWARAGFALQGEGTATAAE